ncbi:MAG: hypothetical protein R3E96_03570 [Planctomycetota bacterium]
MKRSRGPRPKPGNTAVNISGSKVREQLVAGEVPDPRIMRESTARILVDYYAAKAKPAPVLEESAGSREEE